MKKSVVQKIVGAMLTSMLLVTTGCGGGGGGGGTGAPSTVTGVAAAGAVIAGTVTLKDSANPPTVRTKTTTTTDGSYSFDITGLTKPFMLQVVGSAGSNQYTLYSVSPDGGTANLNPLSNLVVATAAGGADLATLFGSSNQPLASNIGTVAAGLNQAVTDVQVSLQAKTSLAANSSALSVNPITAPYKVDGATNSAGLDALLDTLKISVASGVVTISQNGAPIFTGPVTGLTTRVVSGKVTLLASSLGATTFTGFPGITVSVTDATSGTPYGSAVTDASGNYSISGVPQVPYKVAVTQRSGYTFDRTVASDTSANLDFQGAPYGTITGVVTAGPDGVPFAGVTVSAKQHNSANPATTTVTDANGRYSFSGRSTDSSNGLNVYDISVAKTDVYNATSFAFAGGAQTVTLGTVTTATVPTFSAPTVSLLAISGNVVDSTNAVMANVKVKLGLRNSSKALIGGGAVLTTSDAVYATTTDANGNYSLAIPAGFYAFSLTYTNSSGSYLFALGSGTADNVELTSNRTFNFTGSIPPAGGGGVTVGF